MEPHSDEVEIVDAGEGASLDAVRELFREYAGMLRQHAGGEDVLAVQGWDVELASLPGDYAAPHGALLLALVNGQPAGCGALRPQATGTMELKRLFVRPAFRGQSLGKRLVAEALEQAARLGAQRVRLDTLPFMRSATRLYRSLGFAEIPPYRENPMPGARFFEITVVPAEPVARLVTFQPGHAADFERLNREWLEEYFHVEDADLPFFRDPAGTIIAPGGEVFFVAEGDRLVGTCAVLREGEGVYELARMAVQGDCRGKGYGQWLVTAVLEFARSHGGRRVVLRSNEALGDALRLYERMGFARRPFPGTSGYARANVYMERELEPDV